MIKEIFVNKCETKPRTFLCKCECGSKKIVKIRYLIRGKYPSCGCYAREATRISNKKRSDRSGLHHPLFTTWTMIVARCNYKKQTVYKYYGGRGIKVCDKWNPRITDKGKAF